MNRPESPKRRPSRRCRARQRGAVVAEAAYSILILAFVMTAGIQFGDAMVVRHRLTSAVNRAARICSVGAAATAPACANNQLAVALDTVAARCRPLRIEQPRVEDAGGGVMALRVEVQCQYAGGPWSGLLEGLGDALVLRAQAMMPIQQ